MLTFRQFSEGAIALGDYQLQSKYQHFNHLLFNGELPTIPITWSSNMLGRSGRVLAQGLNFGFNVKPGTIRMEITSLFKSSEERLDGILVHEMIHVYFMAIKDDGREQHGSEFKRKLSELQMKIPFTIPVSDDIMSLELDDNVRSSSIGVMIEKRPDGVWAAFFGKTIWEKRMTSFMNYALRKQTPNTSFSFHFGKTNLHRKYKMYNDGRIGFIKVAPEDAEALEALPRVAAPV